MVELFKKLIIFSTPLFLIFSIFEISNRIYPSEYAVKYKNFQNNKDSIELLILGNSHALRGINPNMFDQRSYSLAMVAQRLETDIDILFQNIDQLPKLKTVVLNISFSSLFETTFGDEYEDRLYFYQKHYNLRKKGKLKARVKQLCATCSFGTKRSLINLVNLLTGSTPKIKTDDNGWMGEGGFKSENIREMEIYATEAVERHSRYLKQDINNMDLIKSSIDLLGNRNINLIFLSTPKDSMYLKNLDKNGIKNIDSFLCKMVHENSNVYYLNLRSNNSFEQKHFYNSDHLNQKGALKATLLLEQFIKDIK